MNKAKFYAVVRANFGALSQRQVDGFERYLDLFEQVKPPQNHQACVLSQVWHETGGRMQPVRETFADTDDQAIYRLEAAWAKGRLPWVSKPYWRRDRNGVAWFGRGDIQITHRSNYFRVGRAIGVDLVSNPDLALKPDVSLQIAWVGMRDGLFTGKKLSDYLTSRKSDYIGARYIVNGQDCATLIADHARTFDSALEAMK